MRRIHALLLLMVFAVSAIASPSIVVDTRLSPEGDIRIGQPIQLEIDLLTDTWLTDSPDFSDLKIAEALVTYEGSQGRNIQRNINGRRYFGLTYSYRFIPLESGVITLPDFEVAVKVGQADEALTARVPGASFAVQSLPSAVADQIGILAGDIRLSQQILSDTQPLTAGQPITREVRVEAQRALALSIPSPTASTQSRLSGNSLPTKINLITDGRGRATGGERIDRIRYLPETAGTYILPELVLDWWDIDENKLRKTTLPSLDIQVVAAKLEWGQSLLNGGRSALQWFGQYPGGWLGLLLTASVLIGLIYRYQRAAVTKSKDQFRRLLSLWHNSRIGLQRSAIQQIKTRPPELTGVYRLIRRQDGSATIRHSLLAPQTQADMLDSLCGYYSVTDQRKLAETTLIKAIRHASKSRSKAVRRDALVPLHPGRRA